MPKARAMPPENKSHKPIRLRTRSSIIYEARTLTRIREDNLRKQINRTTQFIPKTMKEGNNSAQTKFKPEIKLEKQANQINFSDQN